jgi:ABC-type multidrug transport system ATPase subunit
MRVFVLFDSSMCVYVIFAKQEDALFEGFTPTEMLSFYAALKGVPPHEQTNAVQDMLVQMGLATSPYDKNSREDRRNQPEAQNSSETGFLSIRRKKEAASMFVEELSGGQRRRVSIGIALIGDSKLVILDEPTSAMVRTVLKMTLHACD